MYLQRPLKKHIEITSLDKLKWRVVPLTVTRRIAHCCSTGVTFGGCSKGDIYGSFNNDYHGMYRRDQAKFIRMMNDASVYMPKLEEAFQIVIGNKIKESEAKHGSGK